MTSVTFLRYCPSHTTVGDGVGDAHFSEGAEPQQAAITGATSQLFPLVAGPRQMQRGPQNQTPADDLTFLHANHRGDQLNVRFRPRAHANQVLKHAVILRPAIGIAGAVFGDRTDVNGLSANCLRPAHRNAQKMGIAKRHVGNGNLAATRSRCAQFILRNGNAADLSRRSRR